MLAPFFAVDCHWVVVKPSTTQHQIDHCAYGISTRTCMCTCSTPPPPPHVHDLQTGLLQESGGRAGALTLKWRHRGSGWGRSSSSCPMPNPLLNPQLDDPSQVSLLGTTLMTLLKKNIAEPFQLTLLNIGVANFVGTKGGTGSVAVLSCLLLCMACIEWHIQRFHGNPSSTAFTSTIDYS